MTEVTVTEALRASIQRLGMIRLPAAEIQAIHEINQAMNEVGACLQALENLAKEETQDGDRGEAAGGHAADAVNPDEEWLETGILPEIAPGEDGPGEKEQEAGENK